MNKGIATLLVLDGLGVGEMPDTQEKRPLDVGSHTLRSLNTVYRSVLFNSLGFGTGNLTSRDSTLIGKSSLGYEGADSFLGHNYMIGNSMEQGVSWYIEDFYDSLDQYFSQKYSVEFIDGVIALNDNIFIANNIEADLGNVINIVGNLDEVEFSELLEVGQYISQNINPMRTIVMGGSPLNKVIVERNIKSLPLNSRGSVRGIDIPATGIYNDKYQVQHLAKDINHPENLLESLQSQKIDISLVGKSADLFPQYGGKNINTADTEIVIDTLTQDLREREFPFIFANIQDIDLAGHSQDVNRGANTLKIVDERINQIRSLMKPTDILLITADHGNDPMIGHNNHTREYVPLILEGKTIPTGVLQDRESLADVGATVGSFFDIKTSRGKSFLHGN